MRHGAAASNHRPRTMGGGQKILTQNEANCRELSRIPANSGRFLTEKLAFFDQNTKLTYEKDGTIFYYKDKHEEAKEMTEVRNLD